MDKRIYLVVSYRNRKNQFLYTLKKLHQYNFIGNNLTVIIVDDGSDSSNRLEDIVNDYNFYIKLFYVHTKNWINPCVTYNVGFSKIDARDDDIVIIQNPECAHSGNVLEYALNNLTHKDYFVFNCIALNPDQTNSLISSDKYDRNDLPTNSSMYDAETGVDWYVHPKFRPKYYHFCSCITYKNLKLLNGFDMRFKDGDAFDDDEFASRVRQLKLNRQFISDPFVHHLWHPIYQPSSWENLYKNRDLYAHLRSLFKKARKYPHKYPQSFMTNKGRWIVAGNGQSHTVNTVIDLHKNATYGSYVKEGEWPAGFHIEKYYEKLNTIDYFGMSSHSYTCTYSAKTNIKKQGFITGNYDLFKIPKIAHFYWGAEKTSFLRYLTLISFIKFNPNWEVRLYVPKTISKTLFECDLKFSQKNDGRKYHNCDQLDYTKDKDYLTQLPDTIKIIKTDFSNSFIGADAPEAHRSDLLGWQILSTTGGLWCDMDILFFKGINDMHLQNNEYDTLVCFDNRHLSRGRPIAPIGLFLSCPNNLFFKKILSISKNRYDRSDPQCIGTKSISSICRDFSCCCNLFPELTIGNIDYDVVYKYDFQHLHKIYKENHFKELLDNDSIGIHWYGGAPESQNYNNLIDDSNYNSLPVCTMTEAIKYLELENE